MGERKAILHIGTHKTGTTYLQSHFSSRAARLRDDGVLWVSDAYDLPRAIIDAERSGRRGALLDEVRRGLDAAFAQAGTLLLSSEGFSGFAGNGYRDTPLLAASCGELLGGGAQVTVVIYLRRQDRFYESYYTQMIQQGESYDLATFRERVPPASLRWLPIIEAYEAALPGCRLVVRPYERRAFRGQDILADFIDHTGLQSLAGGPPVAMRNDSYSIAALKLARLLNAAFTDQDTRNLVRGALQGSNVTRPFESKNLLDRRERRELLACHEAENAIIRDRFWGGRDWFADDGSEQAAAVDLTRLENEEVTRLVMNLLRHLTGTGA